MPLSRSAAALFAFLAWALFSCGAHAEVPPLSTVGEGLLTESAEEAPTTAPEPNTMLLAGLGGLVLLLFALRRK